MGDLGARDRTASRPCNIPASSAASIALAKEDRGGIACRSAASGPFWSAALRLRDSLTRQNGSRKLIGKLQHLFERDAPLPVALGMRRLVVRNSIHSPTCASGSSPPAPARPVMASFRTSSSQQDEQTLLGRRCPRGGRVVVLRPSVGVPRQSRSNQGKQLFGMFSAAGS